MTRVAHEDFAAFVGLAWADATPDGCLHAAGATKREGLTLEHTPEALEAGGRPRRTRCNGQPSAVGLALPPGPFVAAVRTYAFLGLFPIHPLPLARYRAAFTPSRATDAPTDAALPLARLLPQRATLQPLQPQSPPRRARDPRVAHRRRVVNDTVRITNRLTRTLKPSFPQGLPWFQDKDTPIVCDFLHRWPPLNAAHLARRSTLAPFVRAHPVRSADGIAQRRHAIQAALPVTTDAGVIAPTALLVQARVKQLRGTVEAMATFEHAIAQRAQSHPDCPLFQALPGAGPGFASRLLVACGAQRPRSAAAAALQQYAGIASVTARSGKKAWGHRRLPGPQCLRQTCVEWAAASLRHACWARVSSQQQREKGKTPQAAVRPLACTWSRLLLRCWPDRTPYEEAGYLHALNRRGSSLLHHRAQEA